MHMHVTFVCMIDHCFQNSICPFHCLVAASQFSAPPALTVHEGG